MPLTMGLFGWAYYLTDLSEGIIELRLGHVVFGITFSLSWMILGYALWPESGVIARRPKSARRVSGTRGR